jgi:hypothetical protein
MTDVSQDTQDWTGRTVRTRDGAALGTLGRVHPPNGNGGTWGEVRSRFGRRRLVPLDGAATDGDAGLTVPVDRAVLRAAPRTGPGAPDSDTETTLQRHYTGRGLLADAQARQRDRFGGAKVGAAFFGWIVAVGMTVLLAAVAAGIGAAAGLGTQLNPSTVDVRTVGVVGAVVLLVVLALAYLAGGYVAGRLARFDGLRNGVLSWVVGVIVTIVAAIAGSVVGQSYDVFGRLTLPAVPVDPATLTLSGVVALVVVLLVTLLTAAVGGRMGERFHRRVDREATAVV